MADLTDAQIDAATARGARARADEPRAAAARYDRATDRVIVDLTNGCTFVFPPRLAQGLEAAPPDQLAKIDILGAGYGLHWEALDVDLSVPALLAGLFGTKAYLARRAGQVTSPAKAAAARANGAKGGRPRKGERGTTYGSNRRDIDMDFDFANKRLMAALGGIAAGKELKDFVVVPGWGQGRNIFEALNDAVKHLDERFHADEIDTVDRAFEKLELVRTSDRKNVAAKAILEALVHREAHRP